MKYLVWRVGDRHRDLQSGTDLDGEWEKAGMSFSSGILVEKPGNSWKNGNPAQKGD